MAEVPVDLYRAVRSSDWGKKADKRTENFKSADGSGSLYPLYIGRELPDGGFRAPDVTWFSDANGIDWIRGVEDRENTPNWREGISTSTTCGRMGYLGKFYFLLPKGTPVDASLDVKHTPEDDDEGHYSIRCRSLMRRDAYEGALNNLARAALAKAVELGKQSLHHS